MNFECIFIVTYGRSGSTLLQGIINSIDGCLVRGENHNFCFSLYQAYLSLENTEKRNKKISNSTSAWFGSELLNSSLFKKQLGSIVKTQLLADEDATQIECIGFKEVRYVHLTKEQIIGYLDFLSQFMGKGAIVFLTRDLQDVAKSAWWGERDKEEVTEMLRKFENTMHQYSEANDHVFHIDYKDLVEGSGKLEKLFQFLGAPYRSDIIQSVLAIKHSYQHKQVQKRADNPMIPGNVLHFSIDNKLNLVEGGEKRICGLILMKDELDQQQYSLDLFVNDIAVKIKQNQKSPVFAEKYKQVCHAGASRFTSDSFVLHVGDIINLYLRNGTEPNIVLYTQIVAN